MLNSIAGILGVGGVANSYESISTVTVGAGGQTSVTFSSIPSTYKHLQIRYIGQLVTGGGGDNSRVTINGDTGNNYAYHQLYGTGSTTAVGASTTQPNMLIAYQGGSGTASTFGAGVIDILDYANTNKYKTIRSLNGVDTNSTSGLIFMSSGLWMNTAAVTSITFGYNGTTNYGQYSQFALYGIKG